MFENILIAHCSSALHSPYFELEGIGFYDDCGEYNSFVFYRRLLIQIILIT